MGLKRRNRVSPNFSMASMTDVIFLLLIFFMITSTVVSPNAIKVLLPQGKQQTSAKPLTRVVIDKDLNFYAAFGNEKEQPVARERKAVRKVILPPEQRPERAVTELLTLADVL